MLVLLERSRDGALPDARLFARTPTALLEVQHDASRPVWIRHAPDALDARLKQLARHRWAEADRVGGETGDVLARLFVRLADARERWARVHDGGPVRVRVDLAVSYPPQARHRAEAVARGGPHPPALVAFPARPPMLAALQRVCRGVTFGVEASHGRASAVVRRGLDLLHDAPHPAVPPGETVVVNDTGPYARTESRFGGVTWAPATGAFRAYAFDTPVEAFGTEAAFLDAWPRLLDEAVADAVGAVEQMEGLRRGGPGR